LITTISARRSIRRLLVTAGFALCLALPALSLAADGTPRIEPKAADMAKARSVLIQDSDLTSAFRPDPSKLDQPGIPHCPGIYMPNRSGLTITGTAEADFTNGADRIGSDASFFRTAGDFEAYWRATVRPAYARCLAVFHTQALRPGVKARVLEARLIPFAAQGVDRAAAYRTRILYTKGSQRVEIYRTVVFLATGRGFVNIQIVGVDHACDCSVGLAGVLARRLMDASQG
jgi:hypothetical protein